MFYIVITNFTILATIPPVLREIYIQTSDQSFAFLRAFLCCELPMLRVNSDDKLCLFLHGSRGLSLYYDVKRIYIKVEIAFV